MISILLLDKYCRVAYDGAMAMLDTLRASQQLQEAGIEAGHADALVATFSQSFGERLATRDELHAEIAAVRAELKQTEERLNGRMHELENRLIRWMVATLLAGMGVAAAVAVALAQLVG